MTIHSIIVIQAAPTPAALSPALPIILFVIIGLARAATVGIAFASLKAMRGGFTMRQALLVWYSGLIRGAVSVALCLQLKGMSRISISFFFLGFV